MVLEFLLLGELSL